MQEFATSLILMYGPPFVYRYEPRMRMSFDVLHHVIDGTGHAILVSIVGEHDGVVCTTSFVCPRLANRRASFLPRYRWMIFRYSQRVGQCSPQIFGIVPSNKSQARVVFSCFPKVLLYTFPVRTRLESPLHEYRPSLCAFESNDNQ